MTPVERLVGKLKSAKRSGNCWSAKCPAHNDRRSSLRVSEGEDGRALVKCHAGCTLEAVVSAVGLTVRDLMPMRNGRTQNGNGKPTSASVPFKSANAAIGSLERQLGKRSNYWTYHDANGNPVGFVVRWDRPGGKEIRPVSREGDGWRIGAMPNPRPLYRLTGLKNAEKIVVVEGEKCADAAASIGLAATTSAGGSQAVDKTDWQPLAGKEVWILPDNDAPGRKYAGTVVGILSRLKPVPVVKIIELPGLPDGGDIVDWIDARRAEVAPDDLRGAVEGLAAGSAPEEPPHANEDRFLPFPVDALPEPLQGFVKAAARAIGCDPSYLALPLLVAFAAVIGNTRRLQLKKGWTVPPILWGAVVGESGTAKTAAFKLVMRPIRQLQKKELDRHVEAVKQYELELAQWEKEHLEWKRKKNTSEDPPPKPEYPNASRYIVSDTTVEALAPILLANPRGVLLSRDELAGWISSFDRYTGGKGGADAANWLSMFSSDDIVIDRKTGTPRTIYVPQAAVCVIGTIQPSILNHVLGNEHRESGLAARLLLTCPPRAVKRWTEADIDPRQEAQIARLFERLLELQPTRSEEGEDRPVLVRLNPEAKAVWIDYFDEHAKEQVDLTGELSAAWSKLEEYAARLALVIHFVRWAANDLSLANVNELDASSMGAGIRLAKWFKHEARRVYAIMRESETERDNRRLAEWITRKEGPVSVRSVQQGCRWLKEAGAAETALEDLVKAGLGSWKEEPPSSKGGRPSRVFVLAAPSGVYETSQMAYGDRGSVDVDTVDSGTDWPEVGRLFPDEQGLPD